MARPTFNKRGELDYRGDGLFLGYLGKKRTGKSKLARLTFDSYPFDKVIIDINGTDKPAPGTYNELHGTIEELPIRWPEHLRRDNRPLTLYYQPDAGSKTVLEDQDAIIGMAWSHGKCAVLVHEMGLLAPVHKTPPHTLRILQAGRHRGLSLFWCTDRPVTINPRVISQADLLYIFKLPRKEDRERVASSIGWDQEDFDLAMSELRRHEYLRYDDNEEEPEEGETNKKLMHFPAIPREMIERLDRTNPVGV